MAPLRQHGVNIERPPYYHPPRSRPVTFEEPIKSYCQPTCRVIVCVNQPSGCTRKIENRLEDQTKMATFNRSPKPFEKHEIRSNCLKQPQDQEYNLKELKQPYQPATPKIMINDQTWPTSTVHKSFLRSRSQCKPESVSHAHLVSPNSGSSNYQSEQSVSEASNTRWSPQNQQVSQSSNDCSRRISPVDTRETISISGMSNTQSISSQESSNRVRFDGIPYNAKPLDNRVKASEFELGQLSLPRRSKTVKQLPGNKVLPDTRREEYMWNRQLERASIAHQTYRTLPIVMPKPKARHDLASGTYMEYMYDPSWDLARSKPASSHQKDLEEKIQLAMKDLNRDSKDSVINSGESLQVRPTSSGSDFGTSNPVFNYKEYIDSTRKAY